MPTHKPFTEDPDTWWDKEGPFWTLHAINPLRTQFILNHIKKGRGLDVGCGGGILTEALAHHFDMTGIDTDENLIDIAKHHNQVIDYQHIYLEEFAKSPPELFDLITCLEVLEHVDNPAAMIKSIANITAPNGYVFFSTLNRNPISFLGAIVAAEYILQILPKHTHEYRAFIKPSELIHAASNEGLKLVDIKGIAYNPLFKSFSMCHNTWINYIVCFKKTPP